MLSSVQSDGKSDGKSVAVVYRFYDADGRLLYIGSSTIAAWRWQQHSRHQPWWPLVATATLAHFASRDEAIAAEIAAIQTEQPIHNRMRYDGRSPKPRIIRRRHEGSIYQAKLDGRWCASLAIGGKRLTHCNKDRANVEAWLRDYRAKLGLEPAA